MSVLRINQNPVAINALRNLKITGMQIAKTLERLSSGLRISRAADDAAGLAISEKLRAQVRGLTRASANALDGISLIQTAEGALSEVHSNLQRMRELAVQAANGIYTAGDRAAIQLEVNQLADEIDRISRTTEFNTKQLLDGTLSALTSTDDYTRLQAAVVGNVGKGGNFVLKAAVLDKGRLQVQKTDVFGTERATDAVGMLNELHTLRAGATISSAGPDGTGETGVYQVEVRNFTGNAALDNPEIEGTLAMDTAVLAQAGDAVLENFQNHVVTRDVDKLVFMTYDPVNGGLRHEVTLTTANTGAWNLLATDIANTLRANGGPSLFDPPGHVTFINADGQLEIQLAAGAQLLSIEFEDVDGSGSDFNINVGTPTPAGIYRTNTFVRGVNISLGNNYVGTGMLPLTAASGTSTYTVGNLGTTGQIDIRFDVRHDWSSVLAGATARDTLAWTKYGGTNSIQQAGFTFQREPASASGTFLVSAVDELQIAVFGFDNAAYTSLVAGGWDQDLALAAARGDVVRDAAGNATHIISSVFTGQAGSALEGVYLGFDGILQTGETATFNVSTNNVLTGDQLNTLASLNRFHELGVFDGRDSVELAVLLRGADGSAKVHLSKNDTFEDLAGKISLAIWNPAGGGVVASGILNPAEAPDLVHVNTVGLAKGTISITAPVPGAVIVFAGDEALLKALSLIEVRRAMAPVYSINAFDIERNTSAGSVITSTNEINGLLPGLRLYFDNTLGLRLDAQPPVSLAGGANTLLSFAYPKAFEHPVVSVAGEIEAMFLHIAPRQFALQIGANQGQTVESTLGDNSARALGVAGLLVATSELAQEAISTIDVAINRVSETRSRLGALQNRLEGTIRNLEVAGENLTTSESRIRDADMAKETLAITRNQILLQAGVAALAQANQLPQAVLQLLG